MFPTAISSLYGDDEGVGVGIDSLAKRRREIKTKNFATKDRVKKARLFGFNKIAVCFTTRYYNCVEMIIFILNITLY